MQQNIRITPTSRDARLNGGLLATLDAPLLASLMHSRSDTGFISIYEDIDPADPARARTHAHGELLAMLRSLTGPDDRIQRMRGAIARTQRALDQLPLRPHECSAIAGFVDADIDGHGMWIGLDTHVTASATINHQPRIEPLVEILSTASAVGVIRVSDDTVIVDSFRVDAIHPIARFRVPAGEGSRLKQGPSTRQPQRRTSSSLQHDLFAKTMARYELESLVTWCTANLPSITATHRWNDTLVWGPMPTAGIVSRVLAEHCSVMHAGPAVLVHERNEILARRVTAMRNDQSQHSDAQLVQRLVRGDTSAAVIGEPQTIRALDERRVTALIMASVGRINSDAVSSREAMLRSAAAQGSDIRIVHGDAADLLTAHGGVAATLRF